MPGRFFCFKRDLSRKAGKKAVKIKNFLFLDVGKYSIIKTHNGNKIINNE